MTTTHDWAATAEQQVLDQALPLVARDGWTWRSVLAAGRAAGLSAGETELLLPHGPEDLAALFSRRHDAAAMTLLAGVEPMSLKIRERIARAAMARIDAAAADEAALRRWSGYLALPFRLPLAMRLLWASADMLWRWAGDVSADENHYSKRAILSGILAGAMAVRLSSGREAAAAFVDARIENVMAYEKWKAGRKPTDVLAEIAGALGRLRFG